jgi:hypothetical protein
LSIRKQRKVTGELKDLPVDTLKWLECEGTILEKEFGHAGLFEHWWAKEQLKEKDKELEQEREINTDVAEVMDR